MEPRGGLSECRSTSTNGLVRVQTPVGIEHRLLSSVSRVRAVDIGGAISRLSRLRDNGRLGSQLVAVIGFGTGHPDPYPYPIGIFKPQRVHLRVVPRMTTIPL